jgi:hypothetical protein
LPKYKDYETKSGHLATERPLASYIYQQLLS